MTSTPYSVSSPRPSARSAAFTLIELLTVIAIIGILAAIIIPVVGSVRRSSQNASCSSNLRQWGQAILLYSVDHQGNYVIRGTSNAGSDMTWQAVSTNANNMLYGAYVPHSSLIGIIRTCPVGTDSSGSSYVINRPYISGTTVSPLDKVPLKQVRNPTRFMLMSDMASGVTASNGYSLIGPGGLTSLVSPLFTDTVDTRHHSAANMVFGDGHIESITAADITARGAAWTRVDN
jgi:prepilin-type N-terminal cleavage/methylation domain-containing protein/prepilin-type processing-associated H-X9-DG protein